MQITIVCPYRGHSAYRIAAETFADLALRTADAGTFLITDKDPLPDDGSPVAVIGSDAVNHLAADLYLSRRIDDFGFRYNTDDYRVYTKVIDGRTYLFLAGGRPRSTIYAVYRFFEVFCGCRWFWDGDRIPKTELPLADVDLKESPRFEYRGLRYFAHRSLHRFQAEHWSLEDWEREIDWILKKRLNMFMLRIGIDDLYQRAFPDIVRYPDRDGQVPEAYTGYNDRNLFWSLQYRGELRKKLLAYAFARDLMHPEDCGTMTHWYCRTPIDYLEAKKPKLLSGDNKYNNTVTGQVWDVRDDGNLDDYFHLTDTHIREFGKPELFHTIGLAERSYSHDREENMRLKLYVYRRISTHLKEKYPNAPLLIASWDLWMFFTPEEVQRLIAEFDPTQEIILDYTSDTTRESNFTMWGVVGKFPWIFGIFSGYEANSEIRGYYDLTNERLKIAKDDPMCKGVILWPELSHGDTLIGEYLARNAWDSETLSIPELTDQYCRDRYAPERYDTMSALWRDFMPIIQMRAWSTTKTAAMASMDQFVRIMERAPFKGETNPYSLQSPDASLFAAAVRIMKTLADIDDPDPQMLRDIFDIARTILGRFTDEATRRAEIAYAEKDYAKMAAAMELALALLETLRDLLGLHEDYSLLASLRKLQSVTETNPNFEKTLKQNAECAYCRSYIYENAAMLYVPEMKYLFEAVKRAAESGAEIDREALKLRIAENTGRFHATPLTDMQPAESHTLRELLLRGAELIAKL